MLVFTLAGHRFEIKPDVSEIDWAASAAAASYLERENPEGLKLMIWICTLRLLQGLKKDAFTLLKVNFVKLFEVKVFYSI